jgi:hypothetical protein
MELKQQSAVESDDEAAAVLRDAHDEGLETGLTGVKAHRDLSVVFPRVGWRWCCVNVCGIAGHCASATPDFRSAQGVVAHR